MEKIKYKLHLLFLFSLFLPTIAIAHIHQEISNKIDYKYIINDIKNKTNFKFNVAYINNEKEYLDSFSNLEQKKCEIYINQNNDINEKKILYFIILHEISHCIVGNQIFKKGIKGVDKTINKELILQHFKVLSQKNSPVKVSYYDSYLVKYHELFSDINSLIYNVYFFDLNEKDISKIIDYRKKSLYNKNIKVMIDFNNEKILKSIKQKKIKELDNLVLDLSKNYFIELFLKEKNDNKK